VGYDKIGANRPGGVSAKRHQNVALRPIQFYAPFWHKAFSMRCRVCVGLTVGYQLPPVCLSTCGWFAAELRAYVQQISIDSCWLHVPAIGWCDTRALPSSAANAGSVMLRAEVRGSTLTCFSAIAILTHCYKEV